MHAWCGVAKGRRGSKSARRGSQDASVSQDIWLLVQHGSFGSAWLRGGSCFRGYLAEREQHGSYSVEFLRGGAAQRVQHGSQDAERLRGGGGVAQTHMVRHG
jgi:hypothetical protein